MSGLAPTADRRLGPYTLLTVVGLVAALVTGRAELAAVATPAAVLLVHALADRRPLHVAVRSVRAPERLLEGDRWEVEIDLEWAGAAEVDVLHTGLRGSRHLDADGWTGTATDGVLIRLPVEAERWGRHGLGEVVVRARRPGGMLRWDRTVTLDGSVRVLPRASRLDDLLHPDRPRIAAGPHLAPVRGVGTDIADLRPYVPGDRLRDLSWTASARSTQPWVVVHHPERTGTVVLLLDGFVEVGAPPGALDRAARVVWSVARQHLSAGDRVGLLSTGAASMWLSPVSGRRARWQVLDALLAVGSTVVGSAARRSQDRDRRGVMLPADCIVLGVSPLQSDGFLATVIHHARLGRPTGVVGVEVADLLPAAADGVERAARRLWTAEMAARVDRLAHAGVPTVTAVDDAGPALRVLAARMARSGAVA